MYNLRQKSAATINNPDAGEKTLFLDLDDKVKTKDSEGIIEEFGIAGGGGGGPKVYKALLSQSGTDAPVVTALENTLGGEVVWTRQSAGRYIATLSNAFAGNIFIHGMGSWTGNANVYTSISGGSGAPEGYYTIYKFDNNTLLMETLNNVGVTVDLSTLAGTTVFYLPIVEVYP